MYLRECADVSTGASTTGEKAEGDVARVHKSIRMEAETLRRARALMADGESESAALVRALEAGLDALEAAQATEREGHGTEPTTIGGDALRDALEAHVATLAAEVDALRAQLEVKDGQISALTRITEQSQTLHAVAEHKSLESAEGKRKRRGLLARLIGREG